MDYLLLLQGIKEVVVIAAAVAGVGIAYAGLQAWRKQLTGQTEYELARRLLRATYGVRDAMRFVRSPFMDAAELAAGKKHAEESEITAPSEQTAELIGVYNNRWRHLSEAMSDFLVEKLEAEAVWGSAEVSAWVELLQKRVAKLQTSIQLYFKYRDERPSSIGAAQLNQLELDVYSTSGTEGKDAFDTAVEEAIAAIEEQVRPKLNP